MAKKQAQKKKTQKILLATLIPVGVIAGAASITLPLVLNKKVVVEQEDKQKVDNINNLLENSYNTMSDLLDDLATKGIFLQTETTTAENKQFVWDKNKNVIFLMNEDNTIFYAPEGYTLGQNAAIWKMVKAPTASNTAVYADSFSSTSQYSQFLRDGEKFDKSLTFCSGLDTGSHEKLELTFKKELSQSTEPVVINTMKSTLTVEGSISDINHYGNLAELTVDSIDKAYNEYGSVDAAIKVRQGTINAQEGSDVNSVVITSKTGDDVQVNVGEKGYIGSVGATELDVLDKLDDIVTVDEKAEVTKELIVKDDEVTPEPKESNIFYSGEGTILSPWTIKTTEQLWHFAEKVAEQSQAKYYFNLIADIDMDVLPEGSVYEGQEWIPVGTKTNPFVGIFNGCGFTIDNLKIKAQDNGFMGLFGYTTGTKINSDFKIAVNEEEHKQYCTAWNDSTNTLDETKLSEDHYETVIKNLTLSNVTSKASETKDAREVGSIVGRALHTYFDNDHVTSGEVYGNKCVGGLAGSIIGCIITNCSTGSDVEEAEDNLTVTARGYHCGGMVGGCAYQTETICDASEAFVRCVNYANVNSYNTSTAGWNGGFVGICQTDQYQEGQLCGCTLFEDCINYGDVTTTASSAMGIAMSKRTWVYNRCSNFGNITSANANHASGCYLAGMGTDGVAKCVNCYNEGTISGWADYIGGMTARCPSGKLDNEGFIGCVNKGSLTTPEENTGCVIGSICAGQDEKIYISDVTFENVQELNKSIASLEEYVTVEFHNVEVKDKSGELFFPSNISSVKSNTPLANSLKITSTTGDITVNVPNINITVDGDCHNAFIRNFSDNSTLTINQGAIVSMAGVSGQNSRVINNGTINGALKIDGNAVYGENNGTCECVTFGSGLLGFGHGNKTFVNNGTVKVTATDQNQHVLDSVGGSDCSIIINNYGTIEYDSNGTSYVGYLMCLYNDGDITFNCYEDSVFKTDLAGCVIAPIHEHLYINHKSTAELSVAGSLKDWNTLAQAGKIIVNEF